jgi:hypothetical protein
VRESCTLGSVRGARGDPRPYRDLAPRQRRLTVMTVIETTARTERLWVRLTPKEAAHVADLAAARGLTASDLIRDAVLKRTGHLRRVGRSAMSREAALVIRELTAIGATLQDIVGIARDLGVISPTQLDGCLVELRAAIAAFAR